MIDTKLRSRFQPLFNKIASVFVRFKIQPDRITGAALISGLLAGGLIAFDNRLLGLILLWCSGLLDVLDGSVARLIGKSTKRGAFMDLIFDRMVEAAVILGFYFLMPENALVYILFFIAAMFNFTTFMVAGALFSNVSEKSMHYDVGIAERTETFIVFTLMLLFPNQIVIILGVFNVIIFLTGIIRFRRIMQGEKESTYSPKVKIMSLLVMCLIVITACGDNNQERSKMIRDFNNWEEVVAAGENKEVTILMWGGNEAINQYMDGFVAMRLKEKHGITLKRVPMNPPEYLTKLINEKKSDNQKGTADLLWINAENFLTARTGGLLSGPFTSLLPNLNRYYDLEASDLKYDSGILIEGYEAIWGRAQLVFTYDSTVTPNPPKSYKELLDWAKANPGKFTYPKLPDDFAGTAFVRNAFYELTGEEAIFNEDMSEEAFKSLAKPVMDYFLELSPYLWNKGQSYPATQAQLDELFKNGEIDMTMGFEVGKTAGLVASKVYAPRVKTYVFDTGTIGNSHYLAIPFNAPEQGAALLVIDFLESPEAQIKKMKSEVWGDMPAFDVTKLTKEQSETFNLVEKATGSLSLKELTDKRLPEMKAIYIDWIKAMWIDTIASQ